MSKQDLLNLKTSLKAVVFGKDTLYKSICAYIEERHLVESAKAFDFMLDKHKGQFRKPLRWDKKLKVEYISHPLTIAQHAISLGLADDINLASILLHDVCEECDIAPDELPFCEDIRYIVDLLSFDEHKAKDKNTAKRLYFEAIAKDKRAAMIKVLDRCNNVSTMSGSFSDEKLVEYIEESEEYIIPLLECIEKEEYISSEQSFLIRYHLLSIIESVKGLLISR